jgi:hypothetical protein
MLDMPKRRITVKQKPKTKAKEGAANRSARIYRANPNPKLAAEAAKLTAPQAVAVYGVLARNKAGLTAEQILEKLASNTGFMRSKNPQAMVATNLYDLRHGTGVVKTPGLVEIVGKPDTAHAEKKRKSAKPKPEAAQPASTQ